MGRKSKGKRRRALEAFWIRARTEDRLALLKELARLRIRNVTTHERKGLRREHGRRHKSAGEGKCWACPHFELLVWHHVIQLQHGGTNAPANLVKICEWCHAEIHPWLTAPPLVVDERFRPLWG